MTESFCPATLGGPHNWGESDCFLCGVERPPPFLRRSTRKRLKRSLSPDETAPKKNSKKKLTKKQELLKETLLNKTSETVVSKQKDVRIHVKVSKTAVRKKAQRNIT